MIIGKIIKLFSNWIQSAFCIYGEGRIAAIALDNLGRYLRGEPLRNRVG